MPKAPPVTIINVGYRSTNYWVISAGALRLLVDIGWPGTLGTLKANLHTPGHTDHCVSLLLDDGSTFTGDLPQKPMPSTTPSLWQAGSSYAHVAPHKSILLMALSGQWTKLRADYHPGDAPEALPALLPISV